jgi:hypothetical protein
VRAFCLIAVCVLGILTIVGCDSGTEPEQPQLKTGASAELAIEMPPLFPPEPRRAQVVTEWRVIQGRRIWFRNVGEDPIELEMLVTDQLTSETSSVGKFALAAYTTNFMRLDEDFTTNDYRYLSWLLKYREGYQVETIVVGFAP